MAMPLRRPDFGLSCDKNAKQSNERSNYFPRHGMEICFFFLSEKRKIEIIFFSNEMNECID
jgi:hypothetical protein